MVQERLKRARETMIHGITLLKKFSTQNHDTWYHGFFRKYCLHLVCRNGKSHAM